ncbi:T9SS type A sorting domain-containing protein [Aequorivita todarodis]|uniref:T9SS type A sorting domain-containing protein n=1 Tax=Aequorivita todarodis TaxID=2036821 RepID=UPI00234FD8DC|nr:T9SS type A sorting domain-containing protein [Aequorivita todarodis]MDC8001267.1 T9SS type A sorting domain-containing protein [Aequorivita todarodis]
MKNIYVLFFFLICGFASAQIVNIPDANFKAALVNPIAGIDTNNDGEIQITEAEAANRITASDYNIVSLEGMEYFVNITELYIEENQIEILDVSHNTQLELLFCFENQITSLDLSQNPNLSVVWAYTNPLIEIDISQNIDLEEIIVHQSLLTEIDVTNNPNLKILDCDNMKLTNLDISQNPQIGRLYAYNNELTSLNIKNGNNQNMPIVWIYGNPDLQCIQVDDETYANSQICDQSNYTGWCKDETASYSEDCQLGTEDFSIAEFQLFPNPTGNMLNIQSKENIDSIKIYSTQGILVMGVSSKTVDVSQLPAGMYFAQIFLNGKSFTKKFVKK